MSKEPKAPTAKVGDVVLVRYLENPNATPHERPGKIVALSGEVADVEVERPRATTVRLYGVPMHVGDVAPSTRRPHWAPLEAPTKAK